ncbi:hypothetical protein MACK_004007 [Theileria orientalis]|uniref:AN1-type domain-containing protein n=1 Tax=Theileria orientalis TaxID=68886 RepID=A0A976XKH7_THEOR|nr:hypothetical protein MACK_004007 [Theileria orientalis]UVC54441.1 hypothetical protein MACJ_003988 [Theileria orientalis]
MTLSEDEDDLLLDSVIKETWTCHYVPGGKLPSCKEDTKVVGHDCKYCKRRFCIKHRAPETHGCSTKPVKQTKHGRPKGKK